MNTSNVRIYACGGAGTNIAMPFYKMDKKPGMPNINTNFFDFSKANLPEDFPFEEDAFIVEGIDGSGGNPAENYSEVIKRLPQALVKFPPGDFNIVVYSTSGGSGNPWATLIIRHLAQERIPFIAILIGSNESVRRKINRKFALMNLDNIARELNTPIVISYESNTNATTNAEVDDSARASISLILNLVSREHLALDKKDIENWVFYDKVTKTPAQLALLNIISDKELNDPELAAMFKNPISVASLYKNQNVPNHHFNADYDTSGWRKYTSENDASAIHYVIDTKDIGKIYQEIEKEVAEAEKVSKAREVQAAFAKDENSKADEFGIRFDM